MHAYGFSTGALALGDFETGLSMLAGHGATAIELSALRDHELSHLMSRVTDLDLSEYEYVSVHAPSQFRSIGEAECARMLLPCIELGWPVILHPDAIVDEAAWEPFGSILCIENMDKRKADGRTAAELTRWFERFPAARFCLDLGHARQVDPSLIEARRLITDFGDRLAQIHLSELDVNSHHAGISRSAALALHELAHHLSPVPVILESRIDPSDVALELKMARLALETPLPAYCE